MSSSRPIGVFDSGIGGKAILSAAQKTLKNEQFIYLADTKNHPFGNKSKSELEKICRADVETLLKQGAKLIIIACNTATTQVIDFLRQTFPNVPFVGIEPAIKSACESTPASPDPSSPARIVLLATEGTSRSPRTRELIEKNVRPGQSVEIIPCPGLATAIESGDATKIDATLKTCLSRIASPETVSSCILGCTHYLFIKEKFRQFLPSAVLFDPSLAVARQVKAILAERNLLADSFAF